MNIILIIIYHDFLLPPRRGSHVKSDDTHTNNDQYTPLSPYMYLTSAPLFSVVFTVYSNRIM